MANAVYDTFVNSAANALLGSVTALTNPRFVVIPVSDSYVFNDSHTQISDLSGVLGPEVELTNVALTGVTFTADSVLEIWDAISTPIHAVIVAVRGDNRTQLLCYIDSGLNLTLPLSTGGQRVSITWNEAGICRV